MVNSKFCIKDIIAKCANKVLKCLVLYQNANPGIYSWGQNREGMCAVASLLLMYELNNQKIYPKFITSMNHCFLMLENTVVDLTAIQFGCITDTFVFEDYEVFRARTIRSSNGDASAFEPWEIITQHCCVEDVLRKLKFNESQFNGTQWREILKFLN